jgi:hypothetical protein
VSKGCSEKSEHSVHPEVFGKEYEWVLWIEIIVEGIEEEKSRAWAYHYAARILSQPTEKSNQDETHRTLASVTLMHQR